mmetsp:Transcript_43119/g.131359  ORF Transcript_43119/g.131359 Transcript_43119/m.131359 type:complete len:202 (-) Transcript_43119:1433-2038(-)
MLTPSIAKVYILHHIISAKQAGVRGWWVPSTLTRTLYRIAPKKQQPCLQQQQQKDMFGATALRLDDYSPSLSLTLLARLCRARRNRHLLLLISSPFELHPSVRPYISSSSPPRSVRLSSPLHHPSARPRQRLQQLHLLLVATAAVGLIHILIPRGVAQKIGASASIHAMSLDRALNRTFRSALMMIRRARASVLDGPVTKD